MALWHDRRGRFSTLRAVTLAVLIAPLIGLLYFTATHQLGARPRTEAIHEVGLWGIRFLLASLFITPMRRIARYALLVDVRRMIGVGACLYLLLHFLLYIADEEYKLGVVVSEITLRIYLTIGFTAWVGMMVLGATSNDFMVRELSGIRWRNLHRLIYPIAVLSCIHYFMQSKLQVFEPTWIGGVFLWLLLYRYLHWQFPRPDEFPLYVIAGTWFLVGALTFIVEALAFWIGFNAPPLVVLAVDFNFRAGIRPGWYVWGVGLGVTLIGLVRMYPVSSWRLAPSRSS